MPLRFEPIKISDLEFLYNLLKNRTADESISHKNIPTFQEHKLFIKSKPYKKWYVICDEKSQIGTVYMTQINEIGIHLLPKFKKNIFYQQILDFVVLKYPKSRFLANINPKNKSLISFYKKNGFKLIQYTFELIDNGK